MDVYRLYVDKFTGTLFYIHFVKLLCAHLFDSSYFGLPGRPAYTAQNGSRSDWIKIKYNSTKLRLVISCKLNNKL